ncbi:MAG: recombinase family protein [Anaerotignaceae bacterium]
MIRQQKNDKKCAIYCRLSKDDGTNTESMSIGTQKQMLTDYAKANNLGSIVEYVDDGYSGKNFNRPAFMRMIEDIKNGKIAVCLTKDLSRLGRNYIETGMYIEIFFPENDVRYIAIADGIDTDNNSGSLDIAPFKNILNDMFLKDISKKVKMARRTRFTQGKFMATTAPFGYLKDPLDKNHLIVDERYAPLIRRIFDLAKEGLGIAKIRKILTDEKIPRPAACACDNGSNFDRFFENNEENRYTWSNNSVRGILRNPVYAGHLAGYKRPTKSMKSEKRIIVPLEDWEIIRDTHEAIIDNDDFELVQRLMTSRRRGKPGNTGYDNIFSGIIKCATCGYAMRTSSANRRKRENPIDNIGYLCNTYGVYGTSQCSQHWIEARELHNSVLEDIRKHARMAMLDDKALLDDVLSNIATKSKEDGKRLRRELKQSEKRLSEVDKMFAKLFESNAEGKISERNFLAMSEKYEIEQSELESKIANIKEELETEELTNENAKTWVEQIKEYADITELTAPLLHALIDRITVTEAEVVNGERLQTVNIYYKFIGCIG